MGTTVEYGVVKGIQCHKNVNIWPNGQKVDYIIVAEKLFSILYIKGRKINVSAFRVLETVCANTKFFHFFMSLP